MDRIFGMWYEDKYMDAGVKTLVLLVAAYVLVWLYNLLGGKPVMSWNDFAIEAVVIVAIVAFGAFYYAAGAHRKYRHHVTQYAGRMSEHMKAKKKKR